MIGAFTKPKNKSNYALVVNALTWVSSGTQPSLGSGGTARNAAWSREGEFMNLQCILICGSSGTSAGTGAYYIEVKIPNPAGGYYFIDANKSITLESFGLQGKCQVFDSGTGRFDGFPALEANGDSTNGFRLSLNIPAVGGTYLAPNGWSATVPMAPANNDQFYWNLRIPISGWSA